ncbi:hypothetical protein SAMN05421544_105104 [Riemerella columbipharyngis]|uniref:Uncharacterized protein n=1 Tax=Riemerella columbipharyngis TaxID=1071918 RepID=A0A1G7BDZ2_9FLAO|nr:hypothetical protein SAMN05421544_105104 [Riemerella columbipharyngis]
MEKKIRLIALLAVVAFLITKFFTNYHKAEMIFGCVSLFLLLVLIVFFVKNTYLK